MFFFIVALFLAQSIVISFISCFKCSLVFFKEVICFTNKRWSNVRTVVYI